MVDRKLNTLRVEVACRLDVLTALEWQRLFPGFPDSLEMIQHIQSAGMDRFSFHSLVVWDADRPILMLPLFETRYAVHSGYQGPGSDWLNRLADLLPQVFYPRVLGVGFVEGEWGQIGFDATVPKARLQAAWQLALSTLYNLQRSLKSDLIAFVDFNQQSGAMIPMSALKGYATMASNPCGVLPIRYASLDHYLERLSRGMRKNLRRKLKKTDRLQVVRTTEPQPWQDQIYALYQKTVERSDTIFGVQRPAYFETICQTVPGAEYTLYFLDEQLIGFNLLIRTVSQLVDKYFGMDPIIGREYNLYFFSWLENIQYCIRHQIPLYHAGPAAEGLKAKLAAEFIPAVIVFKHRNPLAQRVLQWLAPHLGYEPEIELPVARLGQFWEANPIESPFRPFVPEGGLPDPHDSAFTEESTTVSA